MLLNIHNEKSTRWTGMNRIPLHSIEVDVFLSPLMGIGNIRK